jgi:hypothetical protein
MMILGFPAPCWHGPRAIRIYRAGLGLLSDRGLSASENLHQVRWHGREHGRSSVLLPEIYRCPVSRVFFVI